MDTQIENTFGSVAQYTMNLLVNGLAVFITAYILSGVIVDSFWVALLTAVIIGVVNTFIRPLVILLTLPLTIFTLGLFVLVINAGLILLVGWLVPGFMVASFWWALLFSVVLSLVNGFLQGFQK